MRPRVLRILFAAIVVAVMVLPYAAMFAPASAAQTRPQYHLTTYVHPAFRSKAFWQKGALTTNNVFDQISNAIEDLMKHLHIKLKEPKEPYARALLLLPKSISLKNIKELAKYMVITGIYPTHLYTIVAGWVTPTSIDKIARLGFVAAILPDVQMDELLSSTSKPIYSGDKAAAKKALEELLARGDRVALEKITAAKKPSINLAELEKIARQKPGLKNLATLPTGDKGLGPIHYTVNITKAIDVWYKYGDMGQYATIAIIDTGVDYASPGLGLGAIARDEHGIPLILDSDEYGLVLTPATATPINSTHVLVNMSQLYYYLPGLNGNGIGYLVKSNKGFAIFGHCRVSYTLPAIWRVPSSVVESSVPPHFGLVVRTLYTPLGVVTFTVPAIIYDNNNDGYYDSVLLDMSTAYYYLYEAAQQCGLSYVFPSPATSKPDYSFADETPVTYGHEIAALDLNGDGYYDFSVGTLAGYVNDVVGVILFQEFGDLAQHMASLEEDTGIPLSNLWIEIFLGYLHRFPIEAWTWEMLGYIWPGMDIWSGQYFDLEYDFHSHGTFCATTAAGRPVPVLTGYGSLENGMSLVTGQAPRAKIAAASALWLENIITAVYFFSGFDEKSVYGEPYLIIPVPGTQNPLTAFAGGIWYWSYTGRHQVDMTSNSYGISGWALWGWASGMDPVSVVMDYTSAVSGTAHFVAAGNGGPGWGTVTMPGAASMVITVGAATEFTYRPFLGYLPGGNKEVVSWSDRGPAETLLSKPDVVAIGSFAFATGRPWDALAWGYLNGLLAFDLFGGTSQATPMTAGVAALVVTMYKELHNGARMPAPLLKTVLMSTASDMGFDPFSQGAGFVDALKAVEAVRGKETLVYNADFANVYRKLLGDDTATFTYGAGSSAQLSWYEPKLVFIPDAGLKSERLVVKGYGLYKAYAVKPRLIYSHSLCGAPGVTMLAPCSGGRVRLDLGSMGYFDTRVLAIIDPRFYERYDLIEISMAYPFKYFNTTGRYTGYSKGILYNGIELWAWFDLNHDGHIQRGETARIQYDLRGANAFHLQVAKLREQLAEIKRLVSLYTGVDVSKYPVKLLLVYRVFGNDWSGTGARTYASVRIEGYKFVNWVDVRAWPSYFYVRGSRTISVHAIRAPIKGIDAGYVVIENMATHKKILVPTTLVGAYTLSRPYQVVNMNPLKYRWLESRSLYKNYYLRGAFDYTWRYESGDWRTIPLLVTNPDVKYLLVEVRWPAADKNYASNLDVQVYGPYTYRMVKFSLITGSPITYRDSNGAVLYRVETMHVHGLQLGAELTLLFTMFFDEPAPGYSRILVPISGPGLYRVVVRNIQFSGNSLEEQFTVKITPISTRVFPMKTTLSRGQGIVARVIFYIPTRVTNPSLNIAPTSEFFKLVGGTLYYGDDTVFAKYFYTKTLSTKTRAVGWTTIYNAALYVKAQHSATSGQYSIEYAVVINGVPVTSVGYMCCGSVNYLLYWNIVPFELSVTIR